MRFALATPNFFNLFLISTLLYLSILYLDISNKFIHIKTKNSRII